MKAYSLDLRRKIVAAVDAGRSQSGTARDFRVGVSTVKRYLKQHERTGALEPKRHPGGRRAIPPDHYPLLWTQLETHPAAILDAQCTMWAATSGTLVSTATMSRTIRKLGWTRKKGRWVPPNGMSAIA